MWNKVISAANIPDVLSVLANEPGKARIIAGATDLILEIERGVRSGIEYNRGYLADSKPGSDQPG